MLLFFFFNDTATTEIYTLSLHDALPISRGRLRVARALLPLPDLVRQGLPREFDRHLAVLERREQQQLDDAPLELAHALPDVLRDEAQHVVGDRELEMEIGRAHV